MDSNANVRFEVGKSYYPADHSFDPVKILKRTNKCVVVENWSGTVWRMLVRVNREGVEYVTDSCVPRSWRNEFTYHADDEVKE